MSSFTVPVQYAPNRQRAMDIMTGNFMDATARKSKAEQAHSQYAGLSTGDAEFMRLIDKSGLSRPGGVRPAASPATTSAAPTAPTAPQQQSNPVPQMPGQDPRKLNQLGYQMDAGSLPKMTAPSLNLSLGNGGLFSGMSGLMSNLGHTLNTGLQNRIARQQFDSRMRLGQYNADLAQRGFDNNIGAGRLGNETRRTDSDITRNTALNRLTDADSNGKNMENWIKALNLSTADW